MFNPGPYILGPSYGFPISREISVPPPAPVVVSANVISTTVIRIVFDQSMVLTIAGWSYLKNAVNLPAASVSGAGTTWDFVVNPMAAGDVIQYEYDSGTGITKSSVTNVPLDSTTGPTAVTNTLLATLGYTSIGANVYNETPNGMLGQSGVAAFQGVSDSIEAYISAPAGLSAPAKFALYELIGTTLGPLIGVTAEIIMDDVLQWRNIPLAGLTIDLGKTYFVAEWSDTNYNMVYDSGVGGPSFESFTFLYSSGYPASITTAQRADYADGFSIYLKYLPN